MLPILLKEGGGAGRGWGGDFSPCCCSVAASWRPMKVSRGVFAPARWSVVRLTRLEKRCTQVRASLPCGLVGAGAGPAQPRDGHELGVWSVVGLTCRENARWSVVRSTREKWCTHLRASLPCGLVGGAGPQPRDAHKLVPLTGNRTTRPRGE